jgi:glucose/arabinose dehydrogenase
VADLLRLEPLEVRDVTRNEVLEVRANLISAEEATAKFQSGEWDGPYGVTVTCGDISASLWGIVVGPRGESDPYIRVVRAELAGDVRAQVETERLERERAANMDVATHPRVASPLEIEAGAATLAPCGHFHPIGGRR